MFSRFSLSDGSKARLFRLGYRVKPGSRFRREGLSNFSPEPTELKPQTWVYVACKDYLYYELRLSVSDSGMHVSLSVVAALRTAAYISL